MEALDNYSSASNQQKEDNIDPEAINPVNNKLRIIVSYGRLTFEASLMGYESIIKKTSKQGFEHAAKELVKELNLGWD